MNHCLNIFFTLVDEKVVYVNSNYNFSPTRREKRNCMIFVAKRNAMITERSA
jgi:hypothetical protein